MMKLLLAACMVVALTGGAGAAHPLVTDDTGTQGVGNYSLEINGEAAREKELLGSVEIREIEIAMTASLSAGLTDTIDLVAGLPWAWNRAREDGQLVTDDKGVADLSLELKWRFYEQRGFCLAIKPGITLPTGDEGKGLGNGRISYGATLIASREFAPFAIHVNAGYSHNEYVLDADRDANRRDIWRGSIAATFDATKRLQLVANVGMESNGHRGDSSWPGFLLGGVIFAVTNDVSLDAGIKKTFHAAEEEVALLVGVAYRF